MRKIGFLGYGKIGRAMIQHVVEETNSYVTFVLDKFCTEVDYGIVCLSKPENEVLMDTDLVVECATADALKEHAEEFLKHCDLMTFSITAFADQEFYEKCEAQCKKYGRHIYIPHGAILGLDGISDAKSLLTEVTIHTVKPPKSFGRDDAERTILFEGTTREACAAWPRNVNVHAAVALAGVGFDRTKSLIISDPAYQENCHDIHVKGSGIEFGLSIKSFATSGVTGAYTPVSACGSLDRILGETDRMSFL